MTRRVALFLALAMGLGPAQGQTTSGKTFKMATATPNPFLRMFGNGQWWTSLSDDAKDSESYQAKKKAGTLKVVRMPVCFEL